MYTYVRSTYQTDVEPVVEDVMHSLYVEALLNFVERRVAQMGQCHKIYDQSHVL